MREGVEFDRGAQPFLENWSAWEDSYESPLVRVRQGG
jgi:hypothetical protein